MTSLPKTSEENAARLRAIVRPLAARVRGRPVFLVDGDRTLTPEDTSRTFLKRAGLDPQVIKERFQRDGYCFDAFRFHAEVHVGLGEAVFASLAPTVAREVRLYPGAAELLRRAQQNADVFVISAGIPRIWRCIIEREALTSVRVIGGIDPGEPYVFGREEKGTTCRLFRDEASLVVGIGDSDVDSEMLASAHHAVVVVNHRRNDDLMPHLSAHSSFWQVVPQGTAHENIPVLDFAAVAELATKRSIESLCR